MGHGSSNGDKDGVVHIVDDDEAVREGLALLFRSVSLEARTYPDASNFLGDLEPGHPGCLVCDVRMPGMSGPQLQERLAEIGSDMPMIFITGHGDVPMAVAAMREGAVDFLQKPFSEDLLLQRVQEALTEHRRLCRNNRQREDILARYRELTEREREVMDYLLQGAANKVIAIELGISPRTVELHRARVLAKMEVRTLTDLLRLAEIADLSSAEGT
jgi:two-component system response regulator FixJ